MKKIIISLCFFLSIFSFSIFSEVKVEVESKNSLAVTNISLKDKQPYTNFFYVPLVFPVRIQYVIDSEKFGENFFCAGGSVCAFPYQTLMASGSFWWNLVKFNNGGKFYLENQLDAGLFNLFSSYFDVGKGKNVNACNFAPAVEYSLKAVYAGSSKWYFAGGPGLSFTMLNREVLFAYNLNLACGYSF